MDRDDAALGAAARRHIVKAWREGGVAVSAISFREVVMLAERGRVVLPVPAPRWRANWLRAGLAEIPLNGDIALLACQLENLHRDPADRFILATALERGQPLLTADARLLAWPGEVVRLHAGK